MPDKEMARYTTSNVDQYCRYLDIGLRLYRSGSKFSGKFGSRLEAFGISFPYDIRLYDLVFSGILEPSLYVELPVSYFKSWSNFPNCPKNFTDTHDPDAEWYDFDFVYKDESITIEEFLHPYDGILKDSFVRKFQSSSVTEPVIHKHDNGYEFIAGEAYLPFWHIYALANGYYKYRHAESLMSKREGKPRVLEVIKTNIDRFTKTYAEAFERNSWFKTTVAIAYECNVEFSDMELFELSQKYSKVDEAVLKDDLKKFMRLYTDWRHQIEKHGCAVLTKACNNLTQDIYLTVKQLVFLGCSQEGLIDEFKNESRCSYDLPLHEILDYEKALFRQAFVSYGELYCSDIEELRQEVATDVFDKLYAIQGFDAWARAFHDLHKSINTGNRPKASFNQFRVVDSLLIITIRTEIVLREHFNKRSSNMKDFLTEIKKNHMDEMGKHVLSQVCDGNSYKFTKLHDAPPEIFEKIENFESIKKSSEDEFYYVKAIMKFVTARNYFAHHAYKDSEINIAPGKLASEILKSALVTLLFFIKHTKQSD